MKYMIVKIKKIKKKLLKNMLKIQKILLLGNLKVSWWEFEKYCSWDIKED